MPPIRAASDDCGAVAGITTVVDPLPLFVVANADDVVPSVCMVTDDDGLLAIVDCIALVTAESDRTEDCSVVNVASEASEVVIVITGMRDVVSVSVVFGKGIGVAGRVEVVEVVELVAFIVVVVVIIAVGFVVVVVVGSTPAHA
jgi:hypothetical protein